VSRVRDCDRTISRIYDLFNYKYKKSGAVTLLFAAKDKIYNNAAALIEYIEKTTNK
jgi:uncharacterized protein YeaO (DUF488 family)